MVLLAAVHQWPRTGILSPTKGGRGALEALAVAAGGGLADANFFRPVVAMNIACCGFYRMLREPPDIKMEEGIEIETVHTHLLSALCCVEAANSVSLALLCGAGFPNPAAKAARFQILFMAGLSLY